MLSSPGFGVAAGCYCLAYCGLACIGVEAATVKLSNLALPTDQNNQKLITGEADVLKHRDTYYLYFNNWGPCPGVDCCKTSAGCATCCFARYAAARALMPVARNGMGAPQPAAHSLPLKQPPHVWFAWIWVQPTNAIHRRLRKR